MHTVVTCPTLGLEDGLARGREESRRESIIKFIETLQELRQPQEVIIEKLKEKFFLSAEEIEKYLQITEENCVLPGKNRGEGTEEKRQHMRRKAQATQGLCFSEGLKGVFIKY